MDPIIYRDPLRTPQFDSTYLNNPSFVGSFDDEDFVYFFFREGKILQNFSPMGKAPLSPLLKYFSEESPKMESRLKCCTAAVVFSKSSEQLNWDRPLTLSLLYLGLGQSYETELWAIIPSFTKVEPR